MLVNSVHVRQGANMSVSLRPSSALIVLILLLVPSTPALAQLAQGELRGAVVDQSGGVLPGVTITAVHVETGTSRTTSTAENGAYLMPAMPLGTYKVTAELSGFTTMVREGFRLGVGESIAIPRWDTPRWITRPLLKLRRA